MCLHRLWVKGTHIKKRSQEHELFQCFEEASYARGFILMQGSISQEYE